MLREVLPGAHTWWRIADSEWADPLDPSFAQRHGGRWNPPASFSVLFLNEDLVTARLNLRLFIANWPYEPEDLRDDTGPILVGCSLPTNQEVCDAHSQAGIRAVGLPAAYPLDDNGNEVPHARCQAIGARVHDAGLSGVRARSARAPHGAGRELAWFPASIPARWERILAFTEWFWG